MKKLCHLAALLLFLGLRNSAAQYACAWVSNGLTLASDPQTECPLVSYGGETTSVASAIQVALGQVSFKVQGSLSGDLGEIVNDGTVAPPVLSIPCAQRVIDQGGPPQLYYVSRYAPGVHEVTAVFQKCDSLPFTWRARLQIVVLPQPPTVGTGLIDPVESQFLRGAAVTTSRSILASDLARGITGVAADGVSQAVVRINTNHLGNAINLQLLTDQNVPSNSSDTDGGLMLLGGNPSSISNSLSTSADTSLPGGSAASFVIYRAPLNFSRGAQDDTAVERLVNLRVTATTSSGSAVTTLPIRIVRPPIVMVHGLWSNASDVWTHFIPPINTPQHTFWTNLKQNSILTVDYDRPADGSITATDPAYDPAIVSQITRNALGFTYNAPFVLEQMRDFIHSFRLSFGVAAVQADVVAHSMGGNIVRTMLTSNSNWTFLDDSSFGKGPIHKLITIGTPHLGSALARDMLDESNSCVAAQFAKKGDISLRTITLNGNTTVSGAMADLQNGSSATVTFPVAYIAGATTANNLAGLDCGPTLTSPFDLCLAWQLRSGCGIVERNPLANALTSQNWPNVFGEANDAIVSVNSQLSGLGSQLFVFPGVIHTDGIEMLDFSGPSEIETLSHIPEKVVDLLNDNTNDSDFQH